MSKHSYFTLPAVIVDEWLPYLTPAELTVLLVNYRHYWSFPPPRSQPASSTDLIAATGLSFEAYVEAYEAVEGYGLFPEWSEPEEEMAPTEGLRPLTELERRRRRWDSKRKRAALRIFARDGEACRHCGSGQNLCIDHIIPLAQGGSDDDDNLQVLCRSCNSRKGAR